MSGIFTGDIAISSLKVGSSDIAKVMLGGDEVWSGVPDAMVVEGAGTAAVNGLYLRDGNFNNFPKYALFESQSSSDVIQRVQFGATWVVGLAGGFNYKYKTSENTASPDLVENWEAADGDPPAPTVRRATAEDF